MSFELVGILPGPVHNIRSNNPHPKVDFLEPKHLKEEDAKARLEDQVQQAVNEQMDRARVKEAVNNYLEKIKAEKRNVAPKIPHATFHTMATERPHGTGMVRSKTVADMRPTTQTMIESEVRDNLQRMERERTSLEESTYHAEPVPNENATRFKTCSPGPASPPIRTRVVKRPITPTYYREHWVNWRTETPPEPGIRDKPIKWVHKSAQASRVKRVHTPPTPPPGHRDKAMATNTDRQERVSSAMLRHSRSKSCPPPRENPQIYRVHYDDDDASVYGENYYSSRCESPPARPKTAGAIIANNMIEHPRIKTWMTGATDYEKEVAYNLLHTLHGGKGPDMSAKVNNNIRPRSNSASNTRRVTLPKATSLHRAPSSPNLKSPPLNTTGVDTKSLKTWMKKIEKQLEDRAPPTVERPQYSTKVDLKATQPPRHQPRIMTPEAYHHENSHFFVTGGRARGHFVIAPDWVSEGASHRRLLRQAKEAQLRRQRQQNLAISV